MGKPKEAAPRAEWAALAGTSDATLKQKTGRTWAAWVATLDRAGAYGMTHRDIARHLVDAHELGGWWAQTVTVGYERIRGLRDVGQRRGGGYDASKSRTFPVDAAALFRHLADARRREKWLPEGVARVRTAVPDTSLRVDWSDGTQVHFYVTAKGAAKSSLAVQHAKLAAKADVERAKAFWSERLDALGELLR